MNELEKDEMLEPEVEVIDGGLALTAIDRGQMDVQIATAKANPRSITAARREALSLATLDENVAGSCFYSLPRSGKTIEGPSARLAEIITYSWGNIRAEADIVAIDDKFVTAMGTCLDLERNTGYRVRVKRRITDRHGRRYNDDMIGVTSNAAISIALRNCVFKTVPRALWETVYEAARKASLGQGGTITQKRQNALEWFAKTGLSEAQVCEMLGVKGVDDIGEEELITLRGLKTAIKDGETSVEQILRKSGSPSEGALDLNAATDEKALEEQRQTDLAEAKLMKKQLDKIEDGISLQEWREKNEAKIAGMMPEAQAIVDAAGAAAQGRVG